MPGVETGTYGLGAEDQARNRVSLNKVITHWPDMLRVAGSLVTSQVRAYDLLRVVDPVDDTYRRQVNRQLTVQESRHKLARDVCHGKRGTIHQAYRDGMEDRTARSGWSSTPSRSGRRATSTPPSPGSPRSSTATSMCSAATASPRPVPREGLRPLRDPDAVELDDDDDGGVDV